VDFGKHEIQYLIVVMYTGREQETLETGDPETGVL
jgi:hypothetical protein